jgi:mannitol/fructose-specific phosphotransferase system IIA component (Ntr-type)
MAEFMVLTNHLKKNNIIIKTTSKNRWELIDEVVDFAVKNKDLAKNDAEHIRKALVEREKSMSTGIGNGVAIPHCTTDRINDIICTLAVSHSGIDFDAIDGLPVKIVILLLVPKNKLTQHIKTLANIAKIMSNVKLREKLLKLKTPESIIKIIKEYE